MELRKELGEFQVGGRFSILGIRLVEMDGFFLVFDRGGFQLFLLDLVDVEVRVDFSDEIDIFFVERSFYLSYGEKDFED